MSVRARGVLRDAIRRSPAPWKSASLTDSRKAMQLAMRACTSGRVFSVSGWAGAFWPLRWAVVNLAESQAIWTWRTSGY